MKSPILTAHPDVIREWRNLRTECAPVSVFTGEDLLRVVLPMLTQEGMVTDSWAPVSLPRERAVVVAANRKGQVIDAQCISEGTDCSVYIDVKSILRFVLRAGTASQVPCQFFLAHNHPSGDPEPSPEDIMVTRKIAAGASTVGLMLRDHLVIGAGCYVSLAERKIL